MKKSINHKTRPFNFNSNTKITARCRQRHRCAHCNEKLDLHIEHAHHVIPVQTGKRFANTEKHKTFMSSPDNCVILCDQCHEDIGHNNNYGKGAVALPSAFNHSHQAEEYKYSHWRVKKEHQLWSDKINKIWEELIPMKSS